ncbi:MAG: flavin reductase family protein [Lachnospiraceae bacterium]|jgi:flavin reductase (DIM6/NTAB) family NADH-FMN oxidoreductase RutF|nr:flavin reductase family protein [Lachnospiraceae bacterium]
MSVEIGKFQKASSPNPFALVTSQKEDGSTNVMALSWWTHGANKPVPTIVIFVSSKGYTGELLQKNGEFGLCLPDESIAQAAFKCGTCTGRTTDKPKEFGIELEEADTISAKLVAKSQAALECKVVQVTPVQDHIMFLAEVQAVHIHPEYRHVSAVEGYGKLEVR